MASKQIDVTIIKCRDIPKAQLLGKQSPYVIAKYGSQEFRSKTAKDGDKDPDFNETFIFVVKAEEDTTIELKLFSEKKDAHLGTVTADVILALQKGHMHKAFPVSSSDGKPQGQMELRVRCPDVMHVLEASQAAEAKKVHEAQDKYNHALAAARAKYYGEVVEQMAPHEAVTGALFDEHLEHVQGVQKEEEEAMGEVFGEPMKKAQGLVEEVGSEWANLTKELLKDIPETMEEQCKDAKAKFSRQLDTLSDIVASSDRRRTEELKAAEKALIGGMDRLLAQYRSQIVTACDRYKETVKGAVVRYKSEVEGTLRSEAEAKSQQEAASIAPPPPRAPAQPPVHTAPPATSHAPAPVRGVPAPAPAPTVYVYPTPVPAAPRAAAPVSAPPPGYPMTEAERAAAHQQRAEQEAREARTAADRAAMEAQMARQQAAASQEMLRRQIEAQRRAQAVRRGVVAGALLSRAARR